MKKRIKINYLSTLCVGLDIGSRNNYIIALDFDSNPLINMQHIPNAVSGVEELTSMILAVLYNNSQFKNLLIAMESTSFYGVHIANYHSTCDRLKPFHIEVFCLNPKKAACSFNCIRAFEKEQKALNRAITETVTVLNPTEYQILKSIPRIDPVYATEILAEMGSVRCFDNNNALAKYNGTIWRDNQSGEFNSDDMPMNKAGN